MPDRIFINVPRRRWDRENRKYYYEITWVVRRELTNELFIFGLQTGETPLRRRRQSSPMTSAAPRICISRL